MEIDKSDHVLMAALIIVAVIAMRIMPMILPVVTDFRDMICSIYP